MAENENGAEIRPTRRHRSLTCRSGCAAAISIMPIIARVSPCSAGRRRFLFLIGGLTVGLAAIGMAKLADAAQNQWHHLLAYQRYAALILTPAGFGLALFLARRFFQNSQGSGIPQVIAARALPDVESRLSLVSLRVAAGKIAVMMLGLLVRRLDRPRRPDRAGRRRDHVRRGAPRARLSARPACSPAPRLESPRPSTRRSPALSSASRN